MATRKVIEIDVKDESFRKFLDLFQGYQDQLKAMSTFWEDAGEAAKGTEATTASMADTIAATAASTAMISDALEKAAPAATKTDNTMKSMAGHAKQVQESILHATRDLAKWATLSLGAGLIGGGVGLFGIDQLAGTVSQQRKSAQGLGITTGEQQAFNINFASRLVGGDFLSTIQGVKSDVAQQPALVQMGIPYAEIQTADTADLGIDVIKRARQLWQQQGASGHNRQTMDALGLGAVMDFSTWQRIGQASEKDIGDYETQYRKDARTMGASDPIQREWQDFSIQMERAGKQIEAVFVTGLEPLIKPLTKLSADVEHLVAGALSNPHLKEWIADLGEGIHWLGDYLGSEKFKSDLTSAEQSIEGFVAAVRNAVTAFETWFGKGDSATPGIPSVNGPITPDNPNMPGSPAWYKAHPEYRQPGGFGSSGAYGGPRGNAADPSLPGIDANQGVLGRVFNPTAGLNFSAIEKADLLPPGLMRALGLQESGLHAAGPDSVRNGKRYQGMFQLGPEIQHDYGVTNPYDPNQNANAAGMEMRDLLKKYVGNVAEALAAHDWGPTNLDRDIKEHGADWFRNSPPETQNFVDQIAQRLKIQVSVLNQTGAQVAILANAVRQ